MKSERRIRRNTKQAKPHIVEVAQIMMAISEMFLKERMEEGEVDLSAPGVLEEWHKGSMRIGKIWETGVELFKNSEVDWIAQVYKIAIPKLDKFIFEEEKNWNNRGWTYEQTFFFLYDCCTTVEFNLRFFNYETKGRNVSARSHFEQFFYAKKSLNEEYVSIMVDLKLRILREALHRAVGAYPFVSNQALKGWTEMSRRYDKVKKYDKTKYEWETIFEKAWEIWERDNNQTWLKSLRQALKTLNMDYEFDVHDKFYKSFLCFKNKKLNQK